MYIERLNQDYIYQSFEKPLITALLGARQVGKTTLVSEYAALHPERHWVFLTMDDMDEKRWMIAGKLRERIQELSHRKIDAVEKIWVVIDEAQKCPEIFDQVKSIYDKDKGKAAKFILTGSGHLSLHQLSAESLAGRIELYYLREFGLTESVKLQYDFDIPKESLLSSIYQGASPKEWIHFIQNLAPFRPQLIAGIKTQLLWGGLPDTLKRKEDHERLIYLSNYLQTYLEKDVRALTTVSDINLYRQLMDIAAEQTGSIRGENKIKQALGCARDTIKKYRGFLMATLMYQEIDPFINHTLKRLVKSPKGYLFDNGLISYLTGIYDLSILEKTGLIGHRFENWVLKEFRIVLDREAKRNQVYYWHTSGGVKVDFVVEIKPNVFPFEITYSTQIQRKKIKNLRQFLKEEPKASAGFYIYRGDFKYDKATNIYCIPAWAI